MDAAGMTPFLVRIEERLAEAIDRTDGVPGILADAAHHLCIGATAKRLRPRLVYLFGQASGAPVGGLVDLGTAAELVHAASLLHDDVVDNGQLRRDRPTVNARWSNIVAVLAGDWVLSRALVLLQPYAPVITAKAVEVVAAMTGAAMREVEVRGDATLSLKGWREIAEGKTGTLFAWCGEAAALLGGHPEAAARFARFGRHLGVAFQMADDLKDLFGGEPGKDRFSDIRNRSPSMPIVLALEQSSAWRTELASSWSRGEVSQQEATALGEALISSGAANHAIDLLDREVALAFEALGSDRELPWGQEMQRLAQAFCASLRR
jgi:geranylgeranyl pyrophosphate synthase